MIRAALDDFAGTGWGVALQRLGIEEYGVELMPEAVETRDEHGMTTIYHDVWSGLLGIDPTPAHDLYIASPPCQTFSVAGLGAGRHALEAVLGAIRLGYWRDSTRLRELANATDPRTALVIVPLARIFRHRPRYVLLEQVPPVLPVWESCAEAMRKIGYSVWTGYVHAEQYGVPQTRKRSVLIGRCDDGEALPPAPTHSRFHVNDRDRLDPGTLRWVSMSDALGWGMTERPYPTIATGTEAGGTDPAALGGSGARRTVMVERDAYRWVDYPAPTIAGDPRVAPRGCKHPKIGCCSLNRDGSLSGGLQFPSGTLRLTDDEAATLQSYPPGFSFSGNRGARFRQIGNAVPPLMAEALIRVFDD